MEIIGIHGKRRHGKDTIGAFLTEYKFRRFAFADRVRKVLYNMNPVIGVNTRTFQLVWLKNAVDSLGWEKVKQMPEVVRLQQLMATEGARHVIGEDVWIRALSKQLAEENPARVVITDVRFLNEAKWVRDFGGVVWKVVRPGIEDEAGEGSAKHISETELSEWTGFDATIINDGTLHDLKEKVDILYSDYDHRTWIKGGTI